jgi:hypothetical protein
VCAVAALFFADDEEQADSLLAGCADLLKGSNLGCGYSFSIACTSAVQLAAFLATREIWWDTVQMCGHHDEWLAEGDVKVNPVALDRLLIDVVSTATQPSGEPSGHRAFLSCGRVNVD